MNIEQQVISCKQDWDNAAKSITAIQAEMDRPRCINCLHQVYGHCHTFRVSVPEEHLYQPTECGNHEENIPF